MKKSYIFSIALTFLLFLFSSCVKEETIWPECQIDKLAVINLQIGDPEEIRTYSDGSTSERRIEKVFVLVFGSNGKYKAGEKINLSNIVGNESRYPKITTSLTISTGDSVMVLANTSLSELPSGLVKDVTVMADVNGLFPLSYYTCNYIPMCGVMEWGKDNECEMVRAIAKFTININVPASDDVTGIFNSANVRLYFSNLVQSKNGVVTDTYYGDIYNPSSVPHLPTTITPEDPDGTYISTTYLSEFPAATYYLKKYTFYPISETQWSKERFFISIQVENPSDGKYYYYRLEFRDSATGKYLDIKRNSHYTINVTKVKSYGYTTRNEARDNQGSNLEYQILVDENDDSVTSNGQYAVKTDKIEAVVYEDVTTATDLVKFTCVNQFDKTGITTRKVRLVGADKKTVIPTSQLQMCDKNGNAISDNSFSYTSSDEDGYQLKFKSPVEASLPSQQCYVEIRYGNVCHYVPVTPYIFKVTAPADFDYKGGTGQYSVTSYSKVNGGTAVPWTAMEFSTDGGTTWKAKPVWITSFSENAAGSTTDQTYSVTLTKQVGGYPHNDALKAKSAVSGYDLSRGGETANCYIVNRPGTYSLPLVYGNARRADGSANTSAYSSGVSGAYVLLNFIKHDGNAINSPYISGATTAVLIWQDAKDLVKVDAALTGVYPNQKLTFTVPVANICQGNAVVAVTNGTVILWSWHIWVTDYVLGTDNRKFTNATPKDYYFMPYNLGWCDGPFYSARSVRVRFTQNGSGIQKVIDFNQSEAQELGNSPYYQWGRKDPFVAGMLSSGSFINKTWYNAAYPSGTAANPASASWTSGNDCIIKGIINPGTYCSYQYMDYYYYNLWSADNTISSANDYAVIKTVYDPSPTGYHLPASNAFTGFTAVAPSAWDAVSTSWNFAKDGSETVSFPAVGYRSNTSSAIFNVGFYGYCWSAVPNLVSSGRGLNFVSNSVYPLSNSNRAFGFSVRCVKD